MEILPRVCSDSAHMCRRAVLTLVATWISSLALRYNWKFAHFDHLHLNPSAPTSREWFLIWSRSTVLNLRKYPEKLLEGIRKLSQVWEERYNPMHLWLSRGQASDHASIFSSFPFLLEEGMATLSSILAWRKPQTEERGRLQSTGWHRHTDTTKLT